MQEVKAGEQDEKCAILKRQKYTILTIDKFRHRIQMGYMLIIVKAVTSLRAS